MTFHSDRDYRWMPEKCWWSNGDIPELIDPTAFVQMLKCLVYSPLYGDFYKRLEIRAYLKSCSFEENLKNQMSS